MEPEHPVRPAYDKAAAALVAWRKEREAALTADQRREYEKLAARQAAQRREEERRFAAEREKRIAAETRRLLEEKPAPSLRMMPGRPMKERRARTMARGIVEERHAVSMRALAQGHSQERDQRLYEFAGGKSEGPEISSHTIPAGLAAAFRARAAQKAAERDRGDSGRERG